MSEMDLLTYLKNYEPGQLVKLSGGEYCTKEHDSLKISNGKWCWWSRGIGGRSALDYLIKVQDIPFLEEVKIILGEAAVKPPVLMPQIDGLPLNRAIYSRNGEMVDIVTETFFICDAPITSETFMSLSDEQIKKYDKMFRDPECFYRVGDEIRVRVKKIKSSRDRER